jgi:hypothetical protein
MPGLLTELAARARAVSITASSAIEGVIVDATTLSRSSTGRRPPPGPAGLNLLAFLSRLSRWPSGELYE